MKRKTTDIAVLRQQIAEVAQIQIDHAAATGVILAALGDRVKRLEQQMKGRMDT